jgi:ABC-2 type transport system ATP-binding protein
VLFLDEPTTGLDPEVREAMWTEIRRLADEEPDDPPP